MHILVIFLTFYFIIRLKGETTALFQESEMISEQKFSNHEFNTKHQCYCIGSFVIDTKHQVAPSSIFICIKFPLFLSS